MSAEAEHRPSAAERHHETQAARDLRSGRRTIRFMCRACNGTGHSRYYEYRDCDVCNGVGTIASYLEFS